MHSLLPFGQSICNNNHTFTNRLMDIIFFRRWKNSSLNIVSWIVVMEIVYCEIVGNDFFLDIVSWIVVVLSSTKIIYSSSFGEMVRMGTGSVQIVLDLIWRKRKRTKRKIQRKILQFDTLTSKNIFCFIESNCDHYTNNCLAL